MMPHLKNRKKSTFQIWLKHHRIFFRAQCDFQEHRRQNVMYHSHNALCTYLPGIPPGPRYIQHMTITSFSFKPSLLYLLFLFDPEVKPGYFSTVIMVSTYLTFLI